MPFYATVRSCKDFAVDGADLDPAEIVAAEREVFKQLKSQRRHSEANNVQEVVK